MSPTMNLRLALFVKKLLDILFGLLIISSALLLLWMLISPLFIARGAIRGSASAQVVIGSGSEPQFELAFAGPMDAVKSPTYLEEAHGVLRVETTRWGLVFVSNIAKLLTLIGITYLIFLLRSVLQAILQGTPFAPENGVRIRRIGYLGLLITLLHPIVQYIAANEILNQLPVADPVLSPGSPFQVELILASLLILILAQVWSYGWDLEREQALTI